MKTISEIENEFDKEFVIPRHNEVHDEFYNAEQLRFKKFIRKAIKEALESVVPKKIELTFKNPTTTTEFRVNHGEYEYNEAIKAVKDNIKKFMGEEDEKTL